MLSRIVSQLPAAATARRPVWDTLPGPVRGAIEAAVGGSVESAVSQTSGSTPGFASRLRLGDGRTAFVKAISDERPWVFEAYQTEAAKLWLLPAPIPAPRVRHVLTVPAGHVTWFVLVFDDVDGRPPIRPWRLDEARSVLATAASTASALTPAPGGHQWGSIADKIDREPAWHHARERYTFGAAAEALSRKGLSHLTGQTLTHADLRDDNVIVGADGRVWFCDWNFPTIGPAWIDRVTLAISMHGDGLDAEALLAEAGVAIGDDTVDVFLATLLGYYARAGSEPKTDSSPYLRAHQTYYGDVVADWLQRRQGW